MGCEFPKRSKTCIVPAGGDPNGDDAPQILEAFRVCGNDGHIVFENTTYYIGTIMNTTGLKDVDVEVKGTLLWDTNIPYWLANSMPIGFQNQTAAWHLGGENLHFYGHGYGTLNGNGDTWYKFNDGVSNRHGRPHALLITNTKNAVVEGLRFIKSQMWTMTVARSEKVLLQDIYVNNSAPDDSPRSNVNTDGADTVYANNITFLRWTTDNGDDAISPKQNSTNIYIANCTFVNGMGIAVGSIGQYPGQIEVIENITAVDIRCINSGYGARIKTWTGETKGYPPNGGGGGIGHAKNLTFKNFDLDNVNVAWALAQCTNYEGQQGGCDTSKFQVSSSECITKLFSDMSNRFLISIGAMRKVHLKETAWQRSSALEQRLATILSSSIITCGPLIRIYRLHRIFARQLKTRSVSIARVHATDSVHMYVSLMQISKKYRY